MNFISFTGGVLIAVLMVGAMFIMYSCLNSYQIRMMEQIRKIRAVRQVAPALLTVQEDDPVIMHKPDRM